MIGKSAGSRARALVAVVVMEGRGHALRVIALLSYPGPPAPRVKRLLTQKEHHVRRTDLINCRRYP